MAARRSLGEFGGEASVGPVRLALGRARQVLAEQESANIYDDGAMIAAAIQLRIALRDLVASLDAQDGTP